MSSLMQAVCEWARSLPVWEQHVLQRILRSEPFTDEVYSALAESLVEGKDETPVDFSEFDAPETHSNGTKPILRSISEAVNVNALAGSQSIEFAPGLTIIFGRNGSGKS